MSRNDEYLHDRTFKFPELPQEGGAAMRRDSAGGEASGEHILFKRVCRPTQPVHPWMHDRDGSRFRGVIQLTL
jgi:hypothetical protein